MKVDLRHISTPSVDLADDVIILDGSTSHLRAELGEGIERLSWSATVRVSRDVRDSRVAAANTGALNLHLSGVVNGTATDSRLWLGAVVVHIAEIWGDAAVGLNLANDIVIGNSSSSQVGLGGTVLWTELGESIKRLRAAVRVGRDVGDSRVATANAGALNLHVNLVAIDGSTTKASRFRWLLIVGHIVDISRPATWDTSTVDVLGNGITNGSSTNIGILWLLPPLRTMLGRMTTGGAGARAGAAALNSHQSVVLNIASTKRVALESLSGAGAIVTSISVGSTPLLNLSDNTRGSTTTES